MARCPIPSPRGSRPPDCRATLARRRAFSLIELVIVVVVVGIVAAIAIPRFSSATASASDSALAGDLTTMRKALEMYTAEHGGTAPDIAMIVALLTLYSDAAGTSAQTIPDATHPFGPYLRSIPPLSVGKHKGNTGVGTAAGSTIGWIYDAAAMTIRANTSDAGPVEADSSGKLYSSY